MKSPSIRTSLYIPRELHRRLHEVAARKGCSARQLVLDSIERVVAEGSRQPGSHRVSLDPPIIPSTGEPFDLTNEQIYDLI